MSDKFVWLCRNNVSYPLDSFRHGYAKQQGNWDFLVDRFNLLEVPDVYDCTNIVKAPVYNLENLTSDWEDRFYSICDQVAEDVYLTAGDRKITMMYSGGVDSVCILVALMKNSKFKEFLDAGKFEVSLTSLSIDEYPLFFWNFIQENKIPLVPMNYDVHMNEDSLVITGELGDYLIGSNELMSITKGTEAGNAKWPVFRSFIGRNDPNGEVVRAYTTLINKAPFPLETAHQIQWWFNNAMCIQADLVKPYVWSRITDLSTLPTNDKMYRFFYHDLFMTFSFEYMSTRPLFNKTDDVRLWPKKYVINFTGDENFLNKKKTWSQRLSMRMIYKTEIREDLSWDFNAKVYKNGGN
jgi:hypothetical protein